MKQLGCMMAILMAAALPLLAETSAPPPAADFADGLSGGPDFVQRVLSRRPVCACRPRGPVYINGKETTLKKSNDSYYEAKGSGVLMAYGCTVLYNDIGLRTQKGASCSADDLKQAEKAMTAHLSVN